MDIQEGKRNLGVINASFNVWGIGSSLYMLKAYLGGDLDKAMAAGTVGAVGLGVLGALIYTMETQMYGFSPTFNKR